MLRTALIGCGGISRVHVSALMEMADITKLVAIADVLPEKAQAVSEQTGAAPYTDWEKMLDTEKPDVVHLCTPHYLHVPMAKKALAMGIHVLTEKPCAMTLAQLDELQQAQKNSTAQLGVCFQNRCNAASRCAKEWTETKKYGELLGARAVVTWMRGEEYFNSAEWRGTWAQEGGGVMINQAIHTMDLMQWCCGKIESISAQIANNSLQGTIEVEDTCSALLEFAGGKRGLFYATLAYNKSAPILLELMFEQGTLRIEKDNLYLTDANGGVQTISQDETAQKVGKGDWGNGHQLLIADFYDCIQTGRAFAIDAFEGGKAAQAVLQIYESSKKNEKVFL